MQTFIPALAEREKLMNFLLMLILHHLFSPTPTRHSKQEEDCEIQRWLFSAMEFLDSILSDSRDDCETSKQEYFFNNFLIKRELTMIAMSLHLILDQIN